MFPMMRLRSSLMTITLFSFMSTIMAPSLCKRIAYENIFANHSRLGDVSCAELHKNRGVLLDITDG
jgi:hypothetical protein